MRRFGLIGRPLGHSASASYFTEKFSKEGISNCAYALYELPEIGALTGLLEQHPDLCGLNVTIPYKREVIPYLDAVSPEAQAIGAVNCIRRTPDGRLEGFNTDIIGLREALSELLGFAEPGEALILGTGGLRRPCSMRWPSAESPLRWFRATRRRETIPMIICRVRWWRRAG